MPTIEYQHDDFPPGTLPTYEYQLDVTWHELLWAAVTVGRPDLYHVFRHGRASLYEAIFRWSMVRMALEQYGPRGSRLHRTDAFKAMDPTEKGAVNYFLGLVVCKLFSARRLNAPWTLHLDIWRNTQGVRLLSGRSRPDMIAQSTSTADWYAFECKGRASIPGNSEKQRAKDQARRIVSVGGTNCSLHVGAITYYRSDILQFYWRDPEPKNREPVRIPEPAEEWGEYYRPFIEVYRNFGGAGAPITSSSVRIEDLDLTLMIHPSIVNPLMENNWGAAKGRARELYREIKEEGYQPDGLRIIAGDSWGVRFKEQILQR
jgi:hypothetical protein